MFDDSVTFTCEQCHKTKAVFFLYWVQGHEFCKWCVEDRKIG